MEYVEQVGRLSEALTFCLKTLPESISTTDINIALSVLIQTCLSSNYLSIGHKKVSFTFDDTRPENVCDKLLDENNLDEFKTKKGTVDDQLEDDINFKYVEETR